MLGQRDALAYGIDWKAKTNQSDIKKVTGRHPAVTEWDLAGYGIREKSIDGVDFNFMKEQSIRFHMEGGINIYTWHLFNPLTRKNSWEESKSALIKEVLPGGAKHKWFIAHLDEIKSFFSFLEKNNVPIFFRPMHEANGETFWWSSKYNSLEEIHRLWKYIHNYLNDINNIKFIYSYDRIINNEVLESYYPGDEFVDVLALDDFHSLDPGATHSEFSQQLNLITAFAHQHKKQYAIGETGRELCKPSDWFTKTLGPQLEEHIRFCKKNKFSKPMYLLLWRNGGKAHFHVPYKGHPSEKDFLQFVNSGIVELL